MHREPTHSPIALLRPWILAAMLIATPMVGAEAQAKEGRQHGEQRARREALERRVRDRIAEEVQERLGLTEAQTTRLGATNRKFEEQRRLLLAEERAGRMALREQVLRGDSADQQRVSSLVDQLIAIQRKRIDIVAQEQRELAEFLTPVQRATYLSMQDQMRRRLEEMRRGGPGRQGARRRTAPATP